LGANPNGALVKALHAATEPVFLLVRPLARKIPGPLDWTPAIVLLGLEILRRIL
jgi:YggT family protein